MTTPYIDPNLIFAENAPVQDKPAAFQNYDKGWDASRSNDGRPLIPQMNYLTQQADLKNLYIHENGAALPYKDGIAYEENAVVVKDGVLQQLKGGEWVVVGEQEFKRYLLDAGITEAELHSEYNYLMQRLAQIAIDKGWEAGFVVSAGGDNQQEINDRGGSYWREKPLGYDINSRVMLENGYIVKSTIDGNANDPNIDMTGWVGIGNTITVNSIADLITIGNLRNGTRAYVKSYHAGLNSGGGYFTYENSRASENDGGTVINGWVREVNDVALMPAWFGVRTDGTDDPLNPNHELLQAAIDAGFKSFDFGGSNNKYLFNGQVGLKEQTFYSTNAYVFTAAGALVTIEGSYSWLTTEKVKRNGGIRGLGVGFTGKLMVRGFSFTGNNMEGVFDGDNIYNVLFVDNDCYRLKALALSYSGRVEHYHNGYFQTVTIKNNHFASCNKILNGNSAYNINVSSNTFEGCRAGIYIFGNGQPSISTIRIKDNVFEGGGLFLKLGDASASTISGNYLEANNQYDADTEKCQILLTRGGGSYLANHDISNNMFAGTLTQNADTDYQAIKFVGYQPHSFRGTAITNNWSSTELTKSPVRNMIGNIAPKLSKTTGTAVDAKVEFVTASKALSVASNVTAGKLDVMWFDVLLPNSSTRHDMQFTAKLSCIAKTAGGVQLTRFFATFDFAIYSLLVGGGAGRPPENLGVSVGNLTVMQQPINQVVDKVSGETVAQILTSPGITVESLGNRHTFKISGFSAVASPNYGAVTGVDVYAEITGFGGRAYNTVGSLMEYYK